MKDWGQSHERFFGALSVSHGSLLGRQPEPNQAINYAKKRGTKLTLDYCLISWPTYNRDM